MKTEIKEKGENEGEVVMRKIAAKARKKTGQTFFRAI